MRFLYQIHNIGVYICDEGTEWSEKIEENIKVQFDGFEVYKGVLPIEYKLIIRNMHELNERNDAIVVPECSYYYPDGTMRSEYVNVAYKIEEKEVIMWAEKDTWYAPYLLEIMFQKQGITFVHGASVSVDKKSGKLLLAFGGIGKTCFISKAAKKDRVSMLGDDLILVSEKGELYSYPRPFCLYEYHKDLFPQYFKTHKVKYQHVEENMYVKRAIRKMKKILHIIDNNVYSYLPVSPLRLFPKEKFQIEPVPITDIYVLRRNQKYDKVNISTMQSYEEAANFAIDVILHEWDLGLRVILNRYAQGFLPFEEYIMPRHQILLKAFAKASSVNCIDIPEKMNATEVSQALNDIILEGID